MMASHDDASNSRLVVLAACLGQFLVAYNTTAVMTALPALGAAFGMSSEALQWVMNAYMLTCAVLITAAGRLADSFGTMRMFVVALGVFAVGTATILGAGDAAMMLIGRSLQGAGAAGLTSTSLALINLATPEGQRARAVGLWAGAVAFGFGVGPVLGGIMTIAIDWRGPFVLDILFLAAAALPCYWVGRLVGEPHAVDARHPIDYAGIVLLAIALGGLLYALSGANRVGWTAPETLALFAVALIAACAFVVWERRASDPLVCLGFFRRRDYVAGLVGMFLVGFLQMGVIYFFNLFAQAPSALRFTALEAGLALLPFTLMMFVQSLAVPRLLASRGGSRWPVTIGMLIVAIGFWLMHDIDGQTSYAALWWKLVILGFGIGTNYSLLPGIGLRALPDASAGQGSGVINTLLFIGIALGIAAGGVVMEHVLAASIEPVLDRLAVPQIGALDAAIAHGDQDRIDRRLAQLAPADAEQIRLAMREASAKAFGAVMAMMALLALLGAALGFGLIRDRRMPAAS